MGNRLKKKKKKLEEQVQFERRVLFACTIFILVAMIMWCVAISTDYWFVVSGGDGIYIPVAKRYFLYSHSGIWRICRHAFSNETAGVIEGFSPGDTSNITSVAELRGKLTYYTKCKFHEFSASEMKISHNPTIDRTILRYNLTEAVLSCISVFLMALGFIFSCYTFKNPRYMFKRTAGSIHFLSTGCTLSVIEVLINSIEYERLSLHYTYPPGATHTYGYSFVIAWLVFIINLASGCAFMVYSRKRKGKKAPNEEIAMADEPTIIGR